MIGAGTQLATLAQLARADVRTHRALVLGAAVAAAFFVLIAQHVLGAPRSTFERGHLLGALVVALGTSLPLAAEVLVSDRRTGLAEATSSAPLRWPSLAAAKLLFLVGAAGAAFAAALAASVVLMPLLPATDAGWRDLGASLPWFAGALGLAFAVTAVVAGVLRHALSALLCGLVLAAVGATLGLAPAEGLASDVSWWLRRLLPGPASAVLVGGLVLGSVAVVAVDSRSRRVGVTSSRRLGLALGALLAAGAASLAYAHGPVLGPELGRALLPGFEDTTFEIDRYMPSPTGEFVAVSLEADGEYVDARSLWVVPVVDGVRGEPRLVKRRSADIGFAPAWSSDGTRLFFLSADDADPSADGVWEYELATGRTRRSSKKERSTACRGTWGVGELGDDGEARMRWQGWENTLSADRESGTLTHLASGRERTFPDRTGYWTRRDDFPLQSMEMRQAYREDGSGYYVFCHSVHNVDRSKVLVAPGDSHDLRNLDGDRWTARADRGVLYVLRSDGVFESILRGAGTHVVPSAVGLVNSEAGEAR